MKQSLVESFLAVVQALGPDHNAVLVVVFMAFTVVSISLYVVLTAIKTLSKRG